MLLENIIEAAPEDLTSLHRLGPPAKCDTRYHQNMTPLLMFLVGIIHPGWEPTRLTKAKEARVLTVPKVFKLALPHWLQTVQGLGINLTSYGRKEAAIFTKTPRSRSIRWSLPERDAEERYDLIRWLPHDFTDDKVRSGPKISIASLWASDIRLVLRVGTRC